MVGKILNYGSINIDEFFTVPHICKSGETLSSSSYTMRAGGKGANQSAALAKAGGKIYHAGKIGKDALWVRDYMSEQGIDMSLTKLAEDENNGRALIQVSQETGDNAIMLFPGTNGTYDPKEFDGLLSQFGPGDWIVQQNEISKGGEMMRLAADKGLSVLFNPAPLTRGILDSFPFDKVSVLVVNEHEAEDLCREFGGNVSLSSSTGLEIAGELFNRFKTMQGVVVTLGGEGVVGKFRDQGEIRDFEVPSRKVPVKDTTGAGDTFVVTYININQ
ncbi:Ribokinase-like protein [Phycomyces blakesleeanus]|uniref:Ribokinase-like protein n=1 Tax=Phycomyces blakesleeanus TaxID=4837 RepID=A0ABR3AVJ3_PHYBL